ncbi:MAG: GPW/gp25 family protein [Actinomycetota bacterium]
MTSYRKNLDLLGTDLALDYASAPGAFANADLARSTTGLGRDREIDLEAASDLDAADQLLANRLQTHRGELAPLGHPNYGSRHHELIGQPNVERTRNLIKLYVLEALRHEPRIDTILDCHVSAPHNPPRAEVRIDLTVSLTGDATARNLVVPFSLEIGVGQ